MAIWDLLSKRQSDAAKSGVEDVYQYDTIPNPLRVQVTQIGLEAVGRVGTSNQMYSGNVTNPYWDFIDQTYRREKGLVRLGNGSCPGEQLLMFMSACSTSEWLDCLELICIAAIMTTEHADYGHKQDWEVTTDSSTAIDEINYRLKQAGVGYQFTDGQLIRVDSQYIHSEVVKPALSLLSGSTYAGPREEFLKAHEHYRLGEHRQAVAMAANSLESILKAVFDLKNWEYKRGARISDLVKVAKANALWPDYLDNSFDQLVATLQSGLPKIRDNDAAHGQGATPREVPAYVAAYALHLAASNIVFIVEASQTSRG